MYTDYQGIPFYESPVYLRWVKEGKPSGTLPVALAWDTDNRIGWIRNVDERNGVVTVRDEDEAEYSYEMDELVFAFYKQPVADRKIPLFGNFKIIEADPVRRRFVLAY